MPVHRQLRALLSVPGSAVPRLSLAMALVALVGCGREGSGRGEERGPPDVTERAGRVTFTVGGAAGDRGAFGRLSGLAQDGEGKIYAADAEAGEIRVFGPAGELLQRIGRKGSRAGELSQPCCLAFGPDGLLWVRDGGNARYSAFDAQGDSAVFVESRPMAHEDVNTMAPITFDAAGRLVDVGTGFEPGTTEPRLGRFRLGPEGEVGEPEILEVPGPEQLDAKVITREGPTGPVRLYFQAPFGRQYLTAHGPGGRWAEAYNSGYQVRLHNADGSVGMIRGPQLTAPALSPEERERAANAIEQDRERAATDLGFSVPERKPPLHGIYFDGEGRLWVEHAMAQSVERRADLFSAEGRLLERRTWPAQVDLSRIGWIGGDVALGVTSDSLGVQRVARVAW